jgi:hypothetical protein
MRTVICAVTATIMLALGMAFLLQATQASSESVEASLETTEAPLLEATLEQSEATAAPDVAAVTTPIAFRQVQSVSIRESPGAGSKDPAAAPAETSPTDYHEVKASPRATLDQDRTAAAPKATAPEATQEVVSPKEPREEDVSSSGRSSRNASHRRRHSLAAAKQSRRHGRRAQAIPRQEPPPATPALADTGSNEYQTPFDSVSKLFSGAQ